MFDPRSPYHRRMWHYESQNPLSVAQLVALGSLDARTAALLWLLIDRHRSGREDATDRIWRLVNLQLWGDMFLTGRREHLWQGVTGRATAASFL